MLRRRALHATSSVRQPRRAVRDRALTCTAAALNVSALALPEVARLLETSESRVASVWHSAQRSPHRHSASQHRCDAPTRRMASKVGFRCLWHSLDTDV
jgi:hypothetical protein